MTTNTLIYPILSFCNSSSNLNSIKIQPNSISKQQYKHENTLPTSTIKTKRKKLV